MSPLVFTPADLAARWNCSLDVVYDLLRSGRLRGFHVGSQWRVSASQVEKYEGGET